MPTDSVALVYIKSQTILAFLDSHPIDWSDKELAKRGGIGDQAGRPPTPSVREFLVLLRQERGLFTQEAFVIHCAQVWATWWNTLSKHHQAGVKAKLYRNFYPSLIDSLHVWSMLVEAQWFDRCVLDSCDDATGDTDLTLSRDSLTIRIALIGPTKAAITDRQYKRTVRNGGHDTEVVTVQLPRDRPFGPGRKRWYRLDDFRIFQPEDIAIIPEIMPPVLTLTDKEEIIQRIDGLEHQFIGWMGFMSKVMNDILSHLPLRRSRNRTELPQEPTLWDEKQPESPSRKVLP